MTRLAATAPVADSRTATGARSRMPTPTDLRAMRELLGYSREQVGAMLGINDDEVRKLERNRTWFTYEGHAALLEGLLAKVNAELDAALQRPPPAFLIAFPNDGTFKDYEPALYEWMRYNSAHRMFTARLLDAWMVSGHRPEVMDLLDAPYQRFLTEKATADSPAAREAWAADYRPIIKSRSGMPKPGQREDTETD